MSNKDTEITAQLVSGSETIPITAKYSSKYSLWIRFENGTSFSNGTQFKKLIVQLKDGSVDLGNCQLISEPNIEGFAGRLIFVSDVYDFESIFAGREVVKLQGAFQNLQLVLPYKSRINRDFKDYTADLAYDLSIYKNLFDRVDQEHEGEPSHIRNLVQKAVIYTEGRKFMEFLDDKLVELENLVAGYSHEEHERHGFYFRKQMWNYIMCSEIMKRTNLKPRGYSGDSEMMNMLYQNDFQGESTFSKLFHKHPVEHPSAQAVRNRRALIAKKLKNYETKSDTPGERLKILSVACGSAFELRDILRSSEDCEKYHFNLFDQDRNALLEAAKWLDQTEKDFDVRVPVSYITDSVRTMLVTSQLKDRWGRFDVIYSLGLFDYLTPRVASAVLTKLYQLLVPGGEMVIGNFHVQNPGRIYMEYWLDWVLYYRTEEEFLGLLSNVPDAQIELLFEDTKSQMFLMVKKPELQ